MPGLAIIYGLFFKVFGYESAWPLKIFLHVLGWGAALLAYGISWELSRKRWFALVCGLLAAVSPEFIYFTNILLTEAPAGFFCMLAIYLMLRFLRRGQVVLIYAAIAAATAAVLIRAEYLLLLFLVLFILAVSLWLNPETIDSTRKAGSRSRLLIHLCIAGMLAFTPILAWSYRNYVNYNFFGLSSYTGDVIYDGIVVAGTNMGYPIVDEDSEAIQLIRAARMNEKQKTLERGEVWPDEWEESHRNTYLDGVMLQRSFDYDWMKQVSPVFKQAAVDSIKKHPAQTIRLIIYKIKKAFSTADLTYGWFVHTGPLPGELSNYSTWHEMYAKIYNAKPGLGNYLDLSYAPAIMSIKIQRIINELYVPHSKSPWFAGWRFTALAGLLICPFGRRFFSWSAFSILSFTILILPLILSYPLGRFLVPGGLLMFIFLVGLPLRIGEIVIWMRRRTRDGYGRDH